MKLEFQPIDGQPSEDFKTALLAVTKMIPADRHKFYATENGKEIIKGLVLAAENNKKANAEGMTWSPEEIEATIVALRAASEDDFKKFIQLLPAHIAGKISEHVNTARSNNGLNKSETLEKGAKKDTPGYYLWLQKRRTHNKVGMKEYTAPMKRTSSKPVEVKKPAPVPTGKPAGVKKPRSYKQFVGKKPHIDRKEEKA
jgi:hypothetical protein